MSDLKAPERRSVAIPCNHCGTDVWVPLVGLCEPCMEAAIKKFRAIMGWPL